MKIDIKYIFIFFLVIIFFLYGLILSQAIDYIFPPHNEDIPNYRIALEILGELSLTYFIYFAFINHLDNIIIILFKRISSDVPNYLNKLLIIAFSSGIFKYIEKSTHKIKYLRKQYINFS